MPGIFVPDFSLPPHPCYRALPTYTCSKQVFSLPTLTLGPVQWLMLPATSLCFYDTQPCSSPPALEGLLSQSGAQAPAPPLQCRPSVDLHPQPTPPYPALALTPACLQRPSGQAIPSLPRGTHGDMNSPTSPSRSSPDSCLPESIVQCPHVTQGGCHTHVPF